MRNNLLWGLIFITVLYMIYYVIHYDVYEQFDEKINRVTKEQCGIICTKVLDCQAFATDDNKTCYLSKTPITGKPHGSIFSLEYNHDDMTCNKLQGIPDPSIATSLDLIKNATYMCRKTANAISPDYRIYVNGEKTLQDLNHLNDMTIDRYTFEGIDWGKQMDLDDNKELITNPTKDNSVIVMREKNEEYLGQYMVQHKCSENISKRDCLDQCINSDDCIGTEWNPVYLHNDNLYERICCPKIKINEIIPRRNDFKFGKFYLKDKIIKDDIETINTIVLS
jgi:hypothetical protein